MKKKSNKTFYIAAITAFAVVMITTFNSNIFAGQKSSNKQPQKYYVTADGGLRMRAEANTNAALVTLIPFGGEITSIVQGDKEETISGKTSRWYKVRYQDESKKEYVGWVFGGFLNENKPMHLCTSLINPPLQLDKDFDAKPYPLYEKKILLNKDGKGSYDVNGVRLGESLLLKWKLTDPAGKEFVAESDLQYQFCQPEDICGLDCTPRNIEDTLEKRIDQCKKNMMTEYGKTAQKWHFMVQGELIEPGVVSISVKITDSNPIQGYKSIMRYPPFTNGYTDLDNTKWRCQN